MKQCKPLAQAWLTHMNITTWYGISWVSMESWHKLVMLFWVSVDVYKQGCNQPLFEIMYKYYFNPQRVHACLASHGKHHGLNQFQKYVNAVYRKAQRHSGERQKKEEKKKRKKKRKERKNTYEPLWWFTQRCQEQWVQRIVQRCERYVGKTGADGMGWDELADLFNIMSI